MQKQFHNYIITPLILIFTILSLITSEPAFALSSKNQKFEGYQIKFDYKKYPNEREIAYQYYLDKRSKYLPGIAKEKIGIDLYDIDNDGKKEIFVYVNGGDRCPRAGCPFATLREITNADKNYKEIPWGMEQGVNSSLYENHDPKVLSSLTLGYHDILFGEKEETITIEKWNGKYYDIGYRGSKDQINIPTK